MGYGYEKGGNSCIMGWNLPSYSYSVSNSDSLALSVGIIMKQSCFSGATSEQLIAAYFPLLPFGHGFPFQFFEPQLQLLCRFGGSVSRSEGHVAFDDSAVSSADSNWQPYQEDQATLNEASGIVGCGTVSRDLTHYMRDM